MSRLLVIRKNLLELYNKGDNYIKCLLRFLLYLIVLYSVKDKLGFIPFLSSLFVIAVISLACSLMPPMMSLTVVVIYTAVQIYSVSPLISLTVILVCIVLYCFLLRLASQYADAVCGMQILMKIRIPYVLPITFGLFSTPLTIIPTCLGIFAIYLVDCLAKNINAIEQMNDLVNPFSLYTSIIEGLITNQHMYTSMIVYSLVIVVVYFVRRLKMDYSFEIAVVAGAIANMVGHIYLMLRWDVGVTIVSVIVSSIISGVIAYIILELVRPLFYEGSENVQFEDDDYYYYVRAVPKVKLLGIKTTQTEIITRDDEAKEETQNSPEQ